MATDTKLAAKSTKSATIKKGARITGAARDKLAADLRKKYEKGQSIRALAEGTGRSYGFVHRLLLDAEVPLGDLDISFYRDDVGLRPEAPVVHASHIDFDVTGRTVVVVDVVWGREGFDTGGGRR